MAQPTFFLQPLAAAISLACFSSVVFAAEADSAHILAPIVAVLGVVRTNALSSAAA